MGIVLTEARKKSSAKITAAFALEEKREVFTLPGRVDSSASSSTNSLIARQHTKLICSAVYILEELSLFSAYASATQLPFDFETTKSGLKKIWLI
jgi:predicted Rossmann fold nucleotide-binding protein DprA/Smf involved in DNA uptake